MISTIAEWTQLTPTGFLGMALLWVPGLIVMWPWGLRGLALFAISPVVSAGIIGGAAVVLPVVQLQWSLGSVLLVCLITAVVSWILALWMRRWITTPVFQFGPSHTRWAPEIPGMVLGAAVMAITLIRTIGSPQNFDQRFDNVFHLNVIRYINDTGNASPLWVGTMAVHNGAAGVYPSGWHALVELMWRYSPEGTTIPAAVNVATVLVTGGVWVVGVAWIGRLINGKSILAGLMSGVVAPAFSAFPLLFLEWGILYPNLYSLTFMPAVVGSILKGFRLQSEEMWSLPVSLIVIVSSIPGLMTAHPGAVLIAGLYLGLVVILKVYRELRSGNRGNRFKSLWGAGIVVIIILLWGFMRSPNTSVTRIGPWETSAQAVGEWLLNAPKAHVTAWVISIAVLLGVWRATKTGKWEIVLFWIAGGVLFVLGASSDEELDWWREALTGGFYTDPNRVAAVAAISSVPAALLGMYWISGRVLGWFASRTRSQYRAAVNIVAMMVWTSLLVVVTQRHVVQTNALLTQQYFRYTPTSEVVTDSEYDVMLKVVDFVPDDATINDIAGTGAGFTYALTGRKVTETHMLNGADFDREYLQNNLDDVSSDPQVCRSIQALNAYYVLDFGDGNTPYSHFDTHPGFAELQDAPGFEVLYQNGPARLLRVTGC